MGGYDKVFMMDIVKFKKEFTIGQEIKVGAGINTLSGYIEYMTCNDEQCLPPKQVEFTVELD